MPTELLRHTLYRVAVDSPVNRCHLLGVCFLFRDILLSTSDLWTSLRIISSYEHPDAFERLLWRLDVQIQRCGSLMLDVHWNTSLYNHWNHTAELFAMLSKNAPFSRWKSVVIEWCDCGDMEDDILTGMGDFRNLVSLKVYECAPGRLLRWVNDSVTSKLTKLEVFLPETRINTFRSEMDSILNYISVIRLPNFDGNPLITLPENIKDITTLLLPEYPIPHVTSVTTTGSNPLQRFRAQQIQNLRYLSTMFTRLACWIRQQCSHLLPRSSYPEPNLSLWRS